MRINIYSEELACLEDEHGPCVRLIHKNVVKGFDHSAIQMIVGKRNIHTKHGSVVDDDSSAITFWFADETSRKYLIAMFEAALQELTRSEAKKAQ